MSQRYELEATRKSGAYEQVISNLTREREDSRRKMVEYESLLGLANRELDERRRRLSET
jgi:hypothetical protein